MTRDEVLQAMEQERRRQKITQRNLGLKAGYCEQSWAQVLWRHDCSARMLFDFVDALGMTMEVR
jgi:hypothetical protein